MNFLEKVIGLGITNVIMFCVMIIYSQVCKYMFPALNEGANASGIYGKVSPLYSAIQFYGWVAFVIMFIGSIVYLLFSAHQDEYEQYREYNPQENNRLQ